MIEIKGKEVTANGGWLRRKGDSVAFTACTLLAGETADDFEECEAPSAEDEYALDDAIPNSN